MSVLKNLENKIRGLVEGTFSRAFRSEVRPVEIARKLAREMEEHKSFSVSRTYAPNEYRVFLYENNAESDEALLKLWLGHGAEVWDDDINVRPALTDFYWMMRPDAPEFGTDGNQPVGKGVIVVGLVRRQPKK